MFISFYLKAKFLPHNFLKVFSFLCIFLTIQVHLLAQRIQVLDMDNQPIPGVLIYNHSQTRMYSTDANGVARATDFREQDTLYFQHSAYQSKSYLYSQLVVLNFRVMLEETLLDLDEVVVSASKWEQDRREVPIKIARIEGEELSFYDSQTSADFLANSNEVFVQKSQLGGGSPMIRGFSANSVLLVVDGIRMNNAIFRAGNLQNVISLDAHSIEKTEVVFGPGSVIYGSDALGGVMDFHTFNPKLAKDKAYQFLGNALLRYATANSEHTGHIDLNFGTKQWAFWSSLTFSDYDDLEMGSRGNEIYQRTEFVDRTANQDVVFNNPRPDVQIASGYSQRNFIQKIRFQPNNELNIQYAFHYSRSSDVPRYDRLIERSGGQLRSAQWFYGPQKWLMHSLSAKYIHKSWLFDQSKLTLAFQDYEESRNDRRFGRNSLRTRTEEVKMVSADLDFDKDLGTNHTLFYGTQIVFNKVFSQGIAQDIVSREVSSVSSRYPNGAEYLSLAAYLNYKANIHERLTSSLGLRYSYVDLSANFTSNEGFFDFPFERIALKNGAVNASLGLAYLLKKDFQLNLNLSSGFRAPNVDDVAKVFDSEPGSVVVPNEQLNPEYAYNLDIGLLKKWGSHIRLEVNAFHTWVNDLMVRRNFSLNGQDSIIYDGVLSRTQAIVNADRARIYGFSYLFESKFLSKYLFQSKLTYTKGETGSGEAVRHVAPLFGSTHLRYTHQSLSLEAYIRYNGAIPFRVLAPSERDKPHIYAQDKNGRPYSPAWYTLNFRASYAMNDYLKINVGLENILDHRYRPYSSGIVAPGRNFSFALRGNF